MCFKKFQLLFFLIISSNLLFAQNNNRKDSYYIAQAQKLIKKTNFYYEKEQLDSVIIMCQQALYLINKISPAYLSKNTNKILLTKAEAYNNIGVIHYEYGNISKSIHHYYTSLKIREKIKDKKSLFESYNNLAFIYKTQGDTANATTLFKQSLKIARETKNLEMTSKALNNLGGLCSLDNSNLALEYYFKSYEIEKRRGNQIEIGKREQNIAVAYQNLNNFASANEWYSKSIESKTKINDLYGLSSSYLALGKLKEEINLYKEAEVFALKAYEISNKIERIENIIASSELLYSIYLTTKNYKKALEMFVVFTENKERQILDANETETVRLQMLYTFNKKIESDSLKTKLEKESLNLKIKGEKQKQFGLYFFILVSIGFSIMMNNRFKKTKKQKKIIELQKQLVEHKNKEITDSINYAKRIQQTLMNNEDLFKKNLSEFFVLFRPKDIVSGDFYWANKKENDFYIALCDSTGHGVPGAFMSLLNISFLNEAINEKNILEPNEILNYVRKRLIDNIGQEGGQDGMDGVLLRINKVKKEITYSAAFNAPIIVSNDSVYSLHSNRMSIGKSPKENESFTLYNMEYNENNLIYLYSDGYTDQFGGPSNNVSGKKFKLKQLQTVLLENSKNSMSVQGEIIESIFDEWKGKHDQVDDMLVIGIKL
jgi:serine phosphatase RsbU (regulator of sigma subunit)